jgi:hypothetical protein
MGADGHHSADPLVFTDAVSSLAQQQPNAISRTPPRCGAVRAMGYRRGPPGVPRGTGATGLWVRRRGPGSNVNSPQAPSDSFVANCPKYATVSGSRTQDRIIFELLTCCGSGPVQGLGSEPRGTPVRIRRPARAPGQAPGIADLALTAHDSPRALAGLRKVRGRLAADSRGAPDRALRRAVLGSPDSGNCAISLERGRQRADQRGFRAREGRLRST